MERLVSTLSSFPDIHITEIVNEAWALIIVSSVVDIIYYTCTRTLHECHEPLSRLQSSCIQSTCGAGLVC